METKQKELVVISGKGGTGKTSIVASFAALAQRVVLADCDVDAADLHLVLEPERLRSEDFSGGKRAKIDSHKCVSCGKCAEVCRFDAISLDGPGNEGVGKTYRVDPIACEGCGVCAWFCPADAVEFAEAVNGKWFVSQTRNGPMVHAELGVAEENSGKLVSLVRREARALIEQCGLKLILVDGSPGIGCPVVASITGADLVLIVTEPTLSGLHDLERVADVTKHFGIPAMVCVNKWDLNPDMTEKIEQSSRQRGLTPTGRVRYDRAVTEAQILKRSVVEFQQDGCAEDIREVWSKVSRRLGELEPATDGGA
ncbi:MAG: ATP-binding protein [Phycisphaerae bacterium]|nr:ATP-binding protein [Phycisphaerae bacterium]